MARPKIPSTIPVVWDSNSGDRPTVWGPGLFDSIAPPEEPDYPKAVLVGRAPLTLAYQGKSPGLRSWQGMILSSSIVYEPGEDVSDLLLLLVQVVDELQINESAQNTGVHLGSMIQTQLVLGDTGNLRMFSVTVPSLGTPENKDLPSQVGLMNIDVGVDGLVSASIYYSFEEFLSVEEDYVTEIEIWRFPEETLEVSPGADRELHVFNSKVPKQTGANLLQSLRSVGLRGFFKGGDTWERLQGNPTYRNSPIDTDVLFVNITESSTLIGKRYAYSIQLLGNSLVKALTWYPYAFSGDVLINGIKVNREGPVNFVPQVVISFYEIAETPPEHWQSLMDALASGNSLVVTLENVIML